MSYLDNFFTTLITLLLLSIICQRFPQYGQGPLRRFELEFTDLF